MYNKGKLTGFGWDTVGKYEFTKRTEFPPLSALQVSSTEEFHLADLIPFRPSVLVILEACAYVHA